MERLTMRTGLLVAAMLATACHGQVAAVAPAMLGIDRTPATLAEPGVFDWSTQQVTGPAIAHHRADHVKRRVQAFTAPAGWAATGNNLNAFTGAPAVPAGDYVPNGPAAVYGTSGTPASCKDKIFFLTQSGLLIKVAKDRSSWQKLALGRTFTKTYVTLSPAGGRAYLLSDDGYFFVVNTDTMTFQSMGSLGATNNQGLAPVVDPLTSNHADARDDVYVATSDGRVRHYAVTGGATPTVTATATHTLSTAFKASPIVLGGLVFIGDQSGNFIRFDANSGTTLSTTPLAYPINAPAALDMDASGTITDAFVNAGTRCHWVNFASGTVVSSRPLYLDENDTDRNGTLSQWNYGVASSNKYWLAVSEALSVNTESPAVNLPGFADFKTTAHITPAETNTRGTAATPAGGPVHAYLRWDVANSFLPNNAVVNGMKLWLNADNPADRNIRPYGVRSTSAYQSGVAANGVWTAGNLSLANMPAIGAPIGTWTTPAGSSGAHGRVTFTNGTWHAWTITSYPSSLPTQYAIGIIASDSADRPMWPGGPGNPDPGNAPAHTKRLAPQFYNNPAVTSPHSYVTGVGVADPTDPTFTANSERRALLEVSAAAKALPSVSIATPPIVDTFGGRKLVYVFNGNTVFALDFTTTTAFADAAGTSTRFNVTRTGRRGVGTYSPTFPPSGANANLYVVENTAAPLMSFDGGSLFLLDRYPADANLTPTSYTYALNKLTLPLGAGDALANYQEFASVTGTRVSSSHMVLDYFDYGASAGALHFSMPTTATGNGIVYRLTP